MTYFSSNSDSSGEGGGWFVDLGNSEGFEPVEGVTLRAVGTSSLMVSLVHLSPGAVAPIHTHTEEQIGLVIEGDCLFELGGVSNNLKEGDVYIAPPGIGHGLEAGPHGCRIVDAFAPARSALLPYSEILV